MKRKKFKASKPDAPFTPRVHVPYALFGRRVCQPFFSVVTFCGKDMLIPMKGDIKTAQLGKPSVAPSGAALGWSFFSLFKVIKLVCYL